MSATDTEWMEWLLSGKQTVSGKAGWDGTQGQIRIMQAQFASEDGAFVGYKEIKTRAELLAARNNQPDWRPRDER